MITFECFLANNFAFVWHSVGTARDGRTDEEILEIIKKNFDLRAGAIQRDLKLRRPIYFKTACYGHFGREDPDFTWEQPKTLAL